MDIKDIVSFTGKSERTVRRWISKAIDAQLIPYDKMAEGSEKASQGIPIDYSINEVEAILNSGSMSKDAVKILMENARNQSKEISVYGESPLYAIIEIIKQNQVFMEKMEESRKQDRELMMSMFSEISSKKSKSKTKLPPATQLEFQNIGEDYYTIAAYQKIRKVSLYDTSSHGKILTGICNREGIQISSVKSTNFVRINSYPESVLKKYFDSMVIG